MDRMDHRLLTILFASLVLLAWIFIAFGLLGLIDRIQSI